MQDWFTVFHDFWAGFFGRLYFVKTSSIAAMAAAWEEKQLCWQNGSSPANTVLIRKSGHATLQ